MAQQPQPTTLSPVLGPRSPDPDPLSPVHGPRSTVHDPHFPVHDFPPPVHDPHFPGPDPASSLIARDSWLYRPFSVGGFVGGLFADDPLAGRVEADTGFLAGFRFGWDYLPRWGLETRLAFSKLALESPSNLQLLPDEKLFLCDVSWLFYPWGDTLWRPYFSVGLGLADVDLYDNQQVRLHETLFGLPLGIGVKYQLNHRLAWRFELADNIAFGGGSRLEDMHNLSLAAGFELRFGGGSRRAYWPWDPGHSWW